MPPWSGTPSFKVTVYGSELQSVCGEKKFQYGFYEVAGNHVEESNTKTVIGDAAETFTLDFPNPPVVLTKRLENLTRNFYATINCPPDWAGRQGIQLAKSANVAITQGGAIGTSYACVAGDGKYACDPGNSSSCSNISAKCSERNSPCTSILTSNCGQLATTTNCGQPGQPACAPGTAQSFDFSVPNWLTGSSTNATVIDVIKVIINWIRNIAISLIYSLTVTTLV